MWMLLPQVNQQVAVRWLVVLAARRLAGTSLDTPLARPGGEGVLP